MNTHALFLYGPLDGQSKLVHTNMHEAEVPWVREVCYSFDLKPPETICEIVNYVEKELHVDSEGEPDDLLSFRVFIPEGYENVPWQDKARLLFGIV